MIHACAGTSQGDAFCLLAVDILVSDRVQVRGELQQYSTYLTGPWKLAIFAPAFIFVICAGRFTDDETRDVVTGGGMALLTFLTAPWCVGMVYQVLAGRRPPRYLFVAVGLLLFSSSWFYDGYLLLRDGS